MNNNKRKYTGRSAVKQKSELDFHILLVGFALILIAVGIFTGVRQLISSRNKIYAADSHMASEADQPVLTSSHVPTGVAGVIGGVLASSDDGKANRIGTACEKVIVGQRVASTTKVDSIDASSDMEAMVLNIEKTTSTQTARGEMMSDTDYDTLLHIVEAEAGGEDIEGRMLVANVIFNRVKDSRFPDTIYDVVWDSQGGSAQFSPTADGRIGTVTISDITKDAVKRVMEGEDESQGALFFIAKDQALASNVTWFDTDLKQLFKHGVHDFYTFKENAAANE